MLLKLHIQNYAIIDELEIDFGKNLNVITGETGAGKSILMGALTLILGQRADSSVLQPGNKKCIVEGRFLIKNNDSIKEFFAANDLDMDEDIVLLRREVTSNGKSRGFINDTPVNLTQLKELAILLVDLHQQFDTLELASENFQREVLDAFSGNMLLVQELKGVFERYSKIKNELAQLKLGQSNAGKELDYNKFLFDELSEMGFKENELEGLDTELGLLNNAENIRQQLSAVRYELEDRDQPILQQLKLLQNKLTGLEQYHPGIGPLNKRLAASLIELKDVAEELEHINASVSYDAARVEFINDRLSAGYKLQKKHNVKTTNELLDMQEQLHQKLDAVENISASIEKMEGETKQLEDQCLVIAKTISGNRTKHLKNLAEKVNVMLAQVGMPNARLKVDLQPVALSAHGSDRVEFLFDANLPAGQAGISNRFEPLSKVASGGELSRLMLSIKSLVAQKLQMPTLIFDEIDTGISGEAAKQVGIIMKNLSASHQLIAITHQPQIAAKADAHYFVYKEIRGDKIITSVKRLNDDERITVIAKMLSGERPTAAAIENAREMVG